VIVVTLWMDMLRRLINCRIAPVTKLRVTVYRCLHGRAPPRYLAVADHLIPAFKVSSTLATIGDYFYSRQCGRGLMLLRAVARSLTTICQPEPSHWASLPT